ncbi:hypothetical protein VP1G_06250 [Cytospora mali]|uniref:Uncharacterized protein n=1 Tax=Cytospora mali TaxID=578113 RepID=A0A194V4U9_CYTMA|nr:hypothetical protein VP1G_06250 [Valsa mali var. pyri (nom. inval.)]
MADSNPGDVKNTTHENGEVTTNHQQDAPSQTNPRRFSQYAEALENPLPQIAVESVPEPVSNLNQLDCDDTASMRPVVQPDDPVDRRSSAVVYAGEEPSRFRKYRTPIIVGLIVIVIILTGTVVGVVVSNRDRGGSGGGGASTTSSSSSVTSSTTPSSSSSSGSSSSTASSTTSAAGSPSSIPSQCADTSNYLTSVSFMSILRGTGYTVTYYATNNATDCCTHCYTEISDGCDSWKWSGGFIGTACSMITGWKGSNSDSTCPHGHTAVAFQQDANNDSLVGGVGPCATLAAS